MTRGKYENDRMTQVQYQAARPEDVPEMTDLFLATLSDMYTRNNISATLPPRAEMLLGYEHICSTGVFHVAELEGTIIAIAGAVIRDHIWYLSAFWARPDLQRMKIGMSLLRRVWEAGNRAGATTFFTWSSIDLTAMASYMKLGMLPGYEIFRFEGTPQLLPSVPSGYETVSLERHVATELDRDVRGTGREVDHDFWSGRAGFQGQQVLRNGNVIGYYYHKGGAIGPAAWNEPHEARAVMTLACQEAIAMEPKISLAILGINHSALRFAFDSGMRLTGFAHFLTSVPFGHMDRYLPSGPMLC